MSITLNVVGKFKNGRSRVAGIHSASNRVLSDSDFKDLYSKLQSDIIPVFDRFKTVGVYMIVSGDSNNQPEQHVFRVYSIEEAVRKIEMLKDRINIICTTQTNH